MATGKRAGGGPVSAEGVNNERGKFRAAVASLAAVWPGFVDVSRRGDHNGKQCTLPCSR